MNKLGGDYNSVFKEIGIQISIPENGFLKIKETLTRIGIASNKSKTLYQSCHILHKQGLYGILHFKELFILDNKNTNIDENDILRRNYICKLLHEWNLATCLDLSILEQDIPQEIIKQVKVLRHSLKDEWKLIPKYTIGK